MRGVTPRKAMCLQGAVAESVLPCPMNIRRLITRRTAAGKTYSSYRQVESRREGGRVRQVTLLNLGNYFEVPEAVEATAQALAARFVARSPIEPTPTAFVTSMSRCSNWFSRARSGSSRRGCTR